MKHTYSVFILLIAGSLLWLAGCSHDERAKAPSLETLRNVPVVTVAQTNVPDVIEATGTVRSVQSSDVAAQSMGNLVAVNVHEGDRVQRGQVLAVIDDAQPRAAVERTNAAVQAAQQELLAAESELALAQSTLKRYDGLYERKSVSPQEYDEIKTRANTASARRDLAKAGLAQAKAAQAQANTSLDYTRIRAPFDGVVTARKADPGTLASLGMPIFTVEETRRFRLEATVNENDVLEVRLGESVPVIIDALGNAEIQGKVSQIVPAADPSSRSFVVKIDLLTDTRLRSGLFGRGEFSRGQRPSLLIPRTAVIERGQLQGVFVVGKDNLAGLRYITLGRANGSNVEVLAGLESGERLVAKPGDFDLNGKRVEAE
jgi:RND family efflux transporter MFP subunit